MDELFMFRVFFIGLLNLPLELIRLRQKSGCLTSYSYQRLAKIFTLRFSFLFFLNYYYYYYYVLVMMAADIYSNLQQNPAELDNWLGDLNPHSKVVILDAYGVPSLRDAAVGDRFQFERLGMFNNLLLENYLPSLQMPKI